MRNCETEHPDKHEGHSWKKRTGSIAGSVERTSEKLPETLKGLLSAT